MSPSALLAANPWPRCVFTPRLYAPLYTMVRNKPGRGSLPYSWEVTLPDLEIQPALLQMFY
eukprot:COSAG04_NODE_16030_length_512_cov_0.610169_1_plen_60_part_10